MTRCVCNCDVTGSSDAEYAPIGWDATTRALAEHVAHTEDTKLSGIQSLRAKNEGSTFIEIQVQSGEHVSQPRTVTADADGSACGSGALLQSHHAATCKRTRKATR